MKNTKTNKYKLTKEDKKIIAGLPISTSSKMTQFCIDTAKNVADFYREEAYPLTLIELKPFLKQITKEFKKIWKK